MVGTESEGETKDQVETMTAVWDFPPTWFGFGIGVAAGAGLAGGHPWYRPVLITLAGLCLAVGMLIHMRSK